MDRRSFLSLLAAGVAGSLASCSAVTGGHPGTASSVGPHTWTRTSGSASSSPITTGPGEGGPTPPSTLPSSPPNPLPQATTIDRLPAAATPRIALTVDDGASVDVLDAYLGFMKQTGVRITFFVNGARPAWSSVRSRLAPLVESGQAQLANHTWDHPDITTLTQSEITEQLERNDAFLRNTYGVSSRPFFRPPYGRHTPWTDHVTDLLGYSYTVMWFGTLGDSTVVTPQRIIANAREWLWPGRIVIGHANHPAVTQTYGQLLDIIRERNLRTVTLLDAFPDTSK